MCSIGLNRSERACAHTCDFIVVTKVGPYGTTQEDPTSNFESRPPASLVDINMNSVVWCSEGLQAVRVSSGSPTLWYRQTCSGKWPNFTGDQTYIHTYSPCDLLDSQMNLLSSFPRRGVIWVFHILHFCSTFWFDVGVRLILGFLGFVVVKTLDDFYNVVEH